MQKINMLNSIKDHPISIEAFLDFSLVLTFAFPKKLLIALLPECLDLDIYNDEWGFIAVAIVDTKKLRVKGFFEFLGADFALIGYRIFVKYKTNKGKRLRGLYILRSETDKKFMETIGNMFTHYKYQQTDISISQMYNVFTVNSRKSGLHIQVKDITTVVELPNESPFSNWKEARRFAGPLPFTFSYDKANRKILIVEGVRGNWAPQPVEVIQQHIPFIDELDLKEGRLANAFIIKQIPYYWKKGIKEVWRP